MASRLPFRGVRDTLRDPGFARLYATRLSAQTSDGVFNVALAGFALFSPERQTSPAGIAAGFAALLLPYSVVGPFAGVLIDRWSRQRILVHANLVRAALIAGVIAIVTSDVPTPLFYAAALLVLSVNRFLLSSLSAALPHVVRRDRLVLANAVSTTSGTLVAIVGGGIGYGLRAAFGADDGGVAVVLAAAGLGYVGSALIAAPMGRRSLGPDAVEQRSVLDAFRHVLRGVGEGARHVWRRRRAGRALAAIAAHRFFYGLGFIATLLLYNEDFGYFRDTGLLGLAGVFVASGAGFVVAALVTPSMARRLGVERWVAVLFAAAAVAELVLGPPYTQPLLLAAAFVVGVAAQGSKICVDSIVQASVDDDFRGRVFSFYDILFNVSFVSAAGVAAVTLPRDGRSVGVLVAIAVGYAVTAAAYAASAPRAGEPSAERVSAR